MSMGVERCARERAQCARAVYGAGEFCISRQEVNVGTHRMPSVFLLELCKRFFCAEESMYFYDHERNSKLESLCFKDVGKQYSQCLRNLTDEVKELQKLTIWRNRIRISAARMAFMLDPQAHSKCQGPLKDWCDMMKRNPKWLGFSDREHVESCLDKALVEMSTEACDPQGPPCQIGNQLHSKSDSTIVFLSSCGLDFGTAGTTLLEANKYFDRDDEWAKGDPKVGWTGFKKGGKQELHDRLRKFYATIYTAAKVQGVETMLPIGLGVYLTNLGKPDVNKDGSKRTEFTLRDEVVKMYFEAQFSLLAEYDWGFKTFFLNAQQFLPTAKKFLAISLAKRGKRAWLLNPSDARAVVMGQMGMYWEKGRGIDYVGEEDYGATSTATLSGYSVCGRALGLSDVMLLCEDSEEKPVRMHLRPPKTPGTGF
eukprot:gene13976-62446_t